MKGVNIMADSNEILVRPMLGDEQFSISVDSSGLAGYNYPLPGLFETASFSSVPTGIYTINGQSTIDPNWVCILVEGKDTWVNLATGSQSEDGTLTTPVTLATEDDLTKFKHSVLEVYNTMNFSKWADAPDVTIGETANNHFNMPVIGSNGRARPGEYIVTYDSNPEIDQQSTYAHYLTIATKAYGAPPQWTPYVDPRIAQLKLTSGHEFLLGRRYLETVISSPTILSLAPGVIKYNNALGELLSDNTLDVENFSPDMFNTDRSGKIVEFTPCWYADVEGGNHGYMKYVITLNKATLVAMSRAEAKNGQTELATRNFPGTSKPYSNAGDVWMDWNNSDNDVIRLFGNGMSGFIDAALDAVGNSSQSLVEYKYVNFYCSGNNSTRENFETSVRSSMVEDLINSSVGSAVKDFAFFTGGLIGEETQSQLTDWANDVSAQLGPLGNLVSMATAMFEGAKMIFPQIVDDCTFGRDAQFTVRFVAGSADIEARYLMRCEFNHLLALVLPRQVAGAIDMYTTPFLVRGLCKGRWNCEMGVITGFQVTYGGQDDGAWTHDAQPTEIEATFSVTPLYSKLVMSSFDDVETWFLRNTGMMEYILTNCGVDLRINQLYMKGEMFLAMTGEEFSFSRGTDALMEHGKYLGIFNKLRGALNW